jgi:hypothetical protein
MHLQARHHHAEPKRFSCYSFALLCALACLGLMGCAPAAQQASSAGARAARLAAPPSAPDAVTASGLDSGSGTGSSGKGMGTGTGFAAASVEASTSVAAFARASAQHSVPSEPPGTGWAIKAANVGLAPSGKTCEQLPAYTGPVEIPAGSVITGVRFISPISLYRGTIVIEHSCFQPTTAGRGLPIVTTTNYNGNFEPGRGKVIIRHSEFDGSLLPPTLAAYATAFIGIADLQRNHVHHFGSGLALYNTGTQLDALVEHNLVTQLLPQHNTISSSHHSDAFTIRDFPTSERPDRVAIIRANRFNCDSTNATGAFFIQPWHGRISNVRIEANLLEGRGWNLALEHNKHGYSNVSAINNRFAPSQHGAAYIDGGEGWAIWRHNHRFAPGRKDGKGAPL